MSLFRRAFVGPPGPRGARGPAGPSGAGYSIPIPADPLPPDEGDNHPDTNTIIKTVAEAAEKYAESSPPPPPSFAGGYVCKMADEHRLNDNDYHYDAELIVPVVAGRIYTLRLVAWFEIKANLLKFTTEGVFSGVWQRWQSHRIEYKTYGPTQGQQWSEGPWDAYDVELATALNTTGQVNRYQIQIEASFLAETDGYWAFKWKANTSGGETYDVCCKAGSWLEYRWAVVP